MIASGEDDLPAAWRARALAELIRSVQEAKSLALALGAGEPGSVQATVQYDRLVEIEAELDALRRGRPLGAVDPSDPFWRLFFSELGDSV